MRSFEGLSVSFENIKFRPLIDCTLLLFTPIKFSSEEKTKTKTKRL